MVSTFVLRNLEAKLLKIDNLRGLVRNTRAKRNPAGPRTIHNLLKTSLAD
jgi:hypothetical protein